MEIGRIASLFLGSCVGVLCATFFAVSLRRLAEQDIRQFREGVAWTLGALLGGGLADYALFDWMLQTAALDMYAFGVGVTFLPLSLAIFRDWYRHL